MAKKRIITSYKNLPAEIQPAFNQKFSDDNWDNIIKVETGKAPFYAVLIDTDEITYLVKVDVKNDDDLNSLKDLLEPNLNEMKDDDSGFIPESETMNEFEE